MLLYLLTGCAPADLIEGSLPATGYTDLRIDTEARGIPPSDVSAVTIGGVPAFDLSLAADGQLLVTAQGGPSGEAAVILTVDGAEIEVGALTYDAPIDPVFERMVAFGASVTMGFQDGTPTPRAQLTSPVMHLARAAGAWLPLPLFRDDLWDALSIEDIGPAPECAIGTGSFTTNATLSVLTEMADPETGELDFTRARVTPTVEPRNLAIGNFRIHQIVHGAPPTDPAYALLTYLAFQNDSTGLGSDTGPSQLDRLEALEPTIIVSTDLYGNDLLGPVLPTDGVDFDRLTEEADFTADLEETLDRLAATGAEVFLANIPRVDRLPRIAQVHHDPDELAIVLERAERFNALLSEHAAAHDTIHIVDTYQYVEDHPDGLVTDRFTLSLGTLGGLISFDGVHFSDTGNALVTQLFIEAIEDTLGVDFPELPLASILARDPHSPFVLEVHGRDPAACD
jgi:hypothetical protein